MLKWKINPLSELKQAGYNQSILLNDKLFSARTLNTMRALHSNISCETLGKICHLTGKQPGDLLEWVDETDEL